MNCKKILFPIFLLTGGLVNAQIINTIAGNGLNTFAGDGGAAISASISNVTGLDVDSAGNVFFIDGLSYRVRKVGLDSTINTYAGTSYGYGGDGGAATSAQLAFPDDVAVDKNGNIYISDQENERIRMVTTDGIIGTFAGNGGIGTSGDGGVATGATFIVPTRLAFDDTGNLYVVDVNRIRKINTMGIISTVTGSSVPVGFAGDGGPATSATFGSITDMTLDHKGNMYIIDSGSRIRKIGTDGIINTIAGNDSLYYSGDGVPASAARFLQITHIRVDHRNNIYVSDEPSGRIRKIDTAGIIQTIIGNGICNFTGDGGDIDTATVCGPEAMAFDGNDNFYFYDSDNRRIRKVTYPPGNLTTTSGINTIGQNDIKVYPNPTRGEVNITNLETTNQVHIYDMLGRLISCTIKITSGGEAHFDITALTSGVYIINIEDVQGKVRSRMKIEKI